jgi:myosin heavy subunit
MDQNNYDIYDDFGPNEFEELFEPPAVEDYSEYQGDDKEWYGDGPPDEEEDFSEYLEDGPSDVEWYYDDNGYYAYILMNGDAQDAQYVAFKLQATNIKPIKIGKSFRPASNGIQYDWYIRVYELSNNAAIKPSKEIINHFFIETFGPPKRREDILLFEVNYLKSQLQQARDEINLNRAQISNFQVENNLKEEELRKIIRDHESFKEAAINRLRLNENEKDSRLKQIQLLNEQISSLKNQNVTNNNVDNKIVSLTEELNQQKDTYSRLIDETAELENKYQNSKEQLTEALNKKENAEYEKQHLLQKLEDREFAIKELGTKCKKYEKLNGRKDENGFARTLKALLKNIELNDASISFIYNEIENTDSVLRILEMLNNNPSEIRSERVESAEKWREIHYNLGRGGNVGRLYYTNLRLDGKYSVIVSDKNSQKFDFRRMKANWL